jgi:predicted DCC family thiol-disulfide oxidoreductase YuxK
MSELVTSGPRRLPARKREGARQLVLYDGVCGLCDRSVRFLLEHDRQAALSFAPLQGATAAGVLRRWQLGEELASLVFVRDEGTPDERVFVRSSGVLRAIDALGGPWRIVAWLRIVPRPLRDALYDLVARHRYAWFGKLDTCALPAPETRARFLP